MKISDNELKQIENLRRARDNLAGQLGSAVLELERLKTQIGAAVQGSLKMEAQVAEQALLSLGLDPKQNYTFRSDGVVMVQAIDGSWAETPQ